MTTTTTFQGMEPGSKNSSRVLCPPGGGSSITFGVEEEQKPRTTRPNRTASNIFGSAEETQSVVRKTNPPGGKSSGIFQDSEPVGSQKRHPPGGKSSGIFGTPGSQGEQGSETVRFCK
ncbi:jupiter microtubule associated homolog 1b isoform X2 [Latimeria chalumnae]|uniref:jupiter microtubule associated homolog 1b isoform X2 n=1 Tax=Latimeria chalumnae TaxID=7897 RepID=UPI0003C189CB|nr:PREDICTED: hematological and neurological expressed 1 protein isoform X2 [Latimeria chalumnae]|eukprot:XP_014345295.1 PREDICTED: hematological and neurological expressed 1 protein isoform X2 [Latimeria chalumnae]